MNLKKDLKLLGKNLEEIFLHRRYKVLFWIFFLISFSVLYYFLVVNVANQSIWISVQMSGAEFITFSVANILLISGLSGILFVMSLFRFSNYKINSGKNFFGFIGGGIAAFGVGCPTCGAFLFGLIGMPLALMYFPFKGLELQVFGIFVLFLSIYLTGKSINSNCIIKR